MKLLIIDDQEYFIAYLSLVLADRGFEVVTASSPHQAIDCFRRGVFDLVLTDVVMPKMSGFELAKNLRSSSVGLPVVFMSGYALDQIEHPGIDEDGDHWDFWQKSSDMTGLITTIDRLITRSAFIPRKIVAG